MIRKTIDRRRLLSSGVALAAVLASGMAGSERVLADAVRGVGPYGPLGGADKHGVRVPAGFTVRLIARSGDLVTTTPHRWHDQPDGGGIFDLPGGEHIYVSNSEIGSAGGGVGAIRFDRAGNVLDARTILEGTSRNCSGGVTPWGTWLSCEEQSPDGQVWECDPTGDPSTARRRPALGAFRHEAAEVVASRRMLFMTEDASSGRLYRYRPQRWPDLTTGRLEAANVDGAGRVTWQEVSPDEPERSASTSPFDGPEGLASWGDSLFMSTKGDKRLWRYDMESERIEVLHDCLVNPETSLSSVDNLFIDPANGNLFVAEDQPTRPQLCIVAPVDDASFEIAPVVEFYTHTGSEVTGACLGSDGTTMYVSSQRGVDGRGMTFAISGPWRRTTPPARQPFASGASNIGLRHARRIGNS